MPDLTCESSTCVDGTQMCLQCASEDWRPVVGYEGTYLVSSLGRVLSAPRRRTTGGVLKQKISKRGYPAVNLVLKGKQATHEVHRLVAAAFLGPRPNGLEVRHFDGNPVNCQLGNLSYGTRSENNLDRLRHGTDPQARKTHCPQGHPYVGDNIRRIPSRPTVRYCRACGEARRK